MEPSEENFSSNRSTGSSKDLNKSGGSTHEVISKKGTLKKKGFWSTWNESWFVLESDMFMEFKTSIVS